VDEVVEHQPLPPMGSLWWFLFYSSSLPLALCLILGAALGLPVLVALLCWLAVRTAAFAYQFVDAMADRPPGDCLLLDRRASARVLWWCSWVSFADLAVNVPLMLCMTLAILLTPYVVPDAPLFIYALLLLPLLYANLAVAQWHILRYNLAIHRYIDGDLDGARVRLQHIGGAQRAGASRVRAGLLIELGRPDQARPLVDHEQPPSSTRLDDWTFALASLCTGDPTPARRMLDLTPPLPRIGGPRHVRECAVTLRAALALVDDEPERALAALDLIGEPMPWLYEQHRLQLRAATLVALDRRRDAEELVANAPGELRPVGLSQIPAIHRLLEGLEVPRLPVFTGSSMPAVPQRAPPDPANPYASTDVAPQAAPEPTFAYAARRRPDFAYALPVETVRLGIRMRPLPRSLVAGVCLGGVMGAGFALWITVLAQLALLPVVLFIGSCALALAPLVEAPVWQPSTVLEPSYRWRQVALAMVPLGFGTALGSLVMTESEVSWLPTLGASLTPVALGAFLSMHWLVPRRRHLAARAVHRAPLDALPEAVARYRAPDTEPWWMLAHLLSGDLQAAEAIDRARPLDARLDVPFAWWFAALDGTLSPSLPGPTSPRLGEGPRYRRSMTVVLRALASDTDLPDGERAEALEAADALPDRFGGGLHRLLWHHLRRHHPDAAEAHAAEQAEALQRGAWVDRAFPLWTTR
jgi:hypothetical protein